MSLETGVSKLIAFLQANFRGLHVLSCCYKLCFERAGTRQQSPMRQCDIILAGVDEDPNFVARRNWVRHSKPYGSVIIILMRSDTPGRDGSRYKARLAGCKIWDVCCGCG